MIVTWHVDYWDRLGWKDPYASKDHTDRQTRYAKARGQAKKWTPQFLVDNEIVQNRVAGQIPELVKRAHEKDAQVSLETTAAARDGKIAVGVKVKPADAETRIPKDAVVRVLLVRKQVATQVPKGENEGKTLTEYHVVVSTARARPIASALTESGLEVAFDLPDGATTKDLLVATLIESPKTMRTLQCAAVGVDAQRQR